MQNRPRDGSYARNRPSIPKIRFGSRLRDPRQARTFLSTPLICGPQRLETPSMATLEAAPSSRMSWRTPAVIIICGCAMAALSFGPRSALGFFLTPMSQENGWGRDVFSMALAMQNLLWGAAQPFAGAIADRYGALRVLSGGALMYVLGLAL